MDKTPTTPGEQGRYGDLNVWGQRWCEIITAHLQLAK
jgi:hypothetical protein